MKITNELRAHPRFIELRLAQIYEDVYNVSYNHVLTVDFLVSFAEFRGIQNTYLLRQIFQDIYKVKMGNILTGNALTIYRQQHVAAAMIFKMPVKSASNVLRLSEGSLYRSPYRKEDFLTEQFIKDSYSDNDLIYGQEMIELGQSFIIGWQIFKGRI